MKIGSPPSSPKPAGLVFHWWHALLLAFAFALVFGLGAFSYRSGALRPVAEFLRAFRVQGFFAPQVPEPVQEAARGIIDEARMYQNNGLPTLYIDLPFENYQRLLEKRNEALKIGVLNTTDEDFVSGEVQLQDGPKLDAKLRLKGDWTDHLEGDKWSFRINLKEDGAILGMRQFSIETPAARNFLNEWAFHKNLQDEGLLTTRYGFVNVLLNGKMMGIYAIEDNFAPEMIESQGRRQGVIIRFNEDPMWNNVANFWSQGITQSEGGSLSVTSMNSAAINTFQETRISEDPVLSAEAETARGLLRAFQEGTRPASEVFDVQQTGLFFALHDLWSAEHGAAWHNLRFYYNPVTGLLEPVAYDSMPFFTFISETSISSVFIKSRIFNDPAIRTAYAQALERITRPEYVEALVDQMTEEHDHLRAALEVEFPEAAIPDYHTLPVDWEKLRQRALALSLEVHPAEIVRGSYQGINLLPGDTGQPALGLDLVNLMILPVEIERVEIGDRAFQVGEAPVLLPGVTDPQKDVFAAVHLNVPLAEDVTLTPETPVNVIARVHGLAVEYRTALSGVHLPQGVQTGPAPRQPGLDEVLAQHSFLQVSPKDPARLLVSPGAWDVTGDLVLPPGASLVVPAGTTLRFEEGSVLYMDGALHLMGEPSAPVLLTAQAAGWSGMVVVNAAQESLWTYATVEKTTGISRGGWIMTGGITFYRSSITLDHVLLGNNQTEDAINVIHGAFKFLDSEFATTYADAFDGDFSDGEVSGCFFHEIKGDAVDVSGSEVTVRDTRMVNVTDKGISTGEDSRMTVDHVQMDTVGIGVASKALSTVTLTNSPISGARFAALAADIKQPVFGPARIDAQNVTILNTQEAGIAQDGSVIVLNGETLKTVRLDVDRLYQEGTLGN